MDGSTARGTHRAGARLAALALAAAACTPWNGTEIPPRAAADVGSFRLADARGRVVVLTFGFASCPDVCPLTLSRMKAALRLLSDDAARVTMAFATVDPERDRPERLRRYVEAFDPRIVPAFAEGRALADALAAYGATAVKRLPDVDRYHELRGGGASYTVDHTAGFFVVDRRGQLRLRVAHDAPPEALAADVRRLLREPVPPPVRVESPVVRLTPSGVGAVYFTLVNPGGEADRLLAVETDAAERAEMHESVRDHDVIRMRPAPEGFAVPPHATVALARGGKHVMLLGVAERDPKRPVALTLRFERSGPVALQAPVSEEP